MDVTQIERVFKYDGVDIPDPDYSLTPKEVQEILSNRYPDIVNASISGPEIVDEKMVYTFGRNLGTKG